MAVKVLVIGEICVDQFVYCEAKRLSPEAPVPVLNPVKTVKNQGMAGNTLANVKALAPDYYTMSLGQNEPITKTRYVEEKSNHMFLRLDEGETTITPFKWTMDIDVLIGQSDIVIVSDYNKGFLSDGDLKEIARKSKLSILDSKRKLTNELISGFTFVKLNESERLNNPNLTSDNIITTLGKKGAEYKNILFESPNPQDTIDVSGAGDTFTAAFVVKYHQLKDERAAIKFANRKASEVVAKRGVVIPEAE
jgi:D-beta-D-heptose 7-phosphate kinase/D-beta-D-heptose 1-phosphate adenosyltransferase